MAISIIQIDGTSYPLGASADNVVFDSTGTGIEAGTVQDAIEAVKLRAGDNITIEDGVISATGGGEGGGYEPPVGGIPKTDLAQSVQASLSKADTALQSQEQADWNESDSSDPAYIKNKPTLATVATSGSYNDLQDKPTIPAAITVDSTITQNGTNPVQGGAIYSALEGKEDRQRVIVDIQCEINYPIGYSVGGNTITGAELYALCADPKKDVVLRIIGYDANEDDDVDYSDDILYHCINDSLSEYEEQYYASWWDGMILLVGLIIESEGASIYFDAGIEEFGYVPTTRKINNKALSSDITLTASDVGALPSSTSIPSKTSDLTNDSGFVQSSSLASVATSGSYNDLSNKPTIPTKFSDLVDDSDYIKAEDVASIVVGSADVVITETPSHICITFVTSSITFTPNTTMSLWAGQKTGTLTVSGTHLKQDITLTVPSGFTAQVSGGTAAQSITIPQTGGEVSGVSVTITYRGADSGSYTGSITATSGSATASVGLVYSQYQGATIIAGTIGTIKAAMGGSQIGELNVSGVKLEDDISASVGNGDFTICATQNGTYGTTATISKASAEASGGATLFVKYTPSSGTSTASGTLTLKTPRNGVNMSKTVTLTGAVAGTLSISPTSASIGIASGGSGTKQFTVQGANLTPATTASVAVSGTGMSADKQTLTVGQDGTINEVVTVTFSGSADSNGTLTVSHADVDNDATASIAGVITTPLPVGYHFDKDKVRYTVLSGQQTVSAEKVDTTITAGAIEIPASVSDLGLEATDGTNTATGTGMTYSVADIPQDAFLNCSSITSLIINASVTSLPNQAFANVGNANGVTLSRITIAASITHIDQNCFYGAKPVILDIYGNPYVGNGNCSGNNMLEKVIIRGSGVASASASSFNTPSLQNGKCSATLYVPDDLIDDYRAKEYIGTAGVAGGVSYCAFPDEGQIKGISELS